MSQARSITGCFACKTKRKKCDETKPQCLRCQKSRTECPGYTYIHDPDKPNRKPRTLAAPRTRVGQSRGNMAQQGTSSTNPKVPSLPQDELRREHGDLPVIASGALCSVVNAWAPSISSTGLNQTSSTSFNTANPYLTEVSRTMGGAPLIVRNQANRLDSFFSPSPQSCTNLASALTTSLVSSRSLLITGRPDDGTMDVNNEDVDSAICRQPVLDRTTESNALPFVLQSYASWIGRMAFEPLKVTGIARDFVFSHFEDGEHSRWIITLLANIGSGIGSVDSELVGARLDPMISALQSAVELRLRAVKSRSKPTKSELVNALDSTVETIFVHFFVSPLGAALILRQEAASIFRRLCPGLLDAPIDLHSLLQHPLGCLRHFAHVDILFGVLTDTDTLFRYEVPSPDTQSTNSSCLVPRAQGDGIVQWVHAVPDEIILIFARLKSARQGTSTPNGEMVALFERDIHDIPPFGDSSSDRLLAIMRSVVHECWRQATFIYLYMAVCGDACDTLRVKGAFHRFMRLLNGTKPGRLPDEFLVLTLLLISPAAHRNRDRKTIKRRLLGHETGRTFRTNHYAMRVIEDYWAHADSEGRPIVWSDVAAARKRVLGI